MFRLWSVCLLLGFLSGSLATPSDYVGSVSGKLYVGKPFANSCFLTGPDGKTQLPRLAECIDLQLKKGSSEYLGDHFGGYDSANWAACQSDGSDCSLTALPVPDPISPLIGQCHQGSVPNYYIDVREVGDVQAGLAFAQKHNIRLVIKNTGHDYKGRSSGPGSLALWTHNVQPALKLTEAYVPEGCSAAAGDAITFGAGQQFKGIYDFAHERGRVVVGGSTITVGAAGGWITGGGHSLLSPTRGLGVDNVLQLKAVLPNGTYVTANRCQNQDIFFALRCGGGSTFGVVMEMTSLTFPEEKLELANYAFASLDSGAARKLISIMVENADKWASEGWGGFFAPGILLDHASGVVMATPNLSHEEAVKSMKPLDDFVTSLSAGNVAIIHGVTTQKSFSEIMKAPSLRLFDYTNNAGYAIASRLVTRKYFQSEDSRKKLTSILDDALQSSQPDTGISFLPMLVDIVAPFAYKVPESDRPGNVGESSVTPAWRSSLWHVQSFRVWDTAKKSPDYSRRQYEIVTKSIQPLRDFTPDGGAYLNEADTFEPDPASAFWGKEHYNRLLSIKKEVDPNNVLTCHQCIGWDSEDARFGCYPKL